MASASSRVILRRIRRSVSRVRRSSRAFCACIETRRVNPPPLRGQALPPGGDLPYRRPVLGGDLDPEGDDEEGSEGKGAKREGVIEAHEVHRERDQEERHAWRVGPE